MFIDYTYTLQVYASAGAQAIQDGNGIFDGIAYPQTLIDSSGWKILIGNIGQAVHVGPLYPNTSSDWVSTNPNNNGLCSDTLYHLQFPTYDVFTQTYKGACLYNVFTDPNENTNVASDYPDIVKRLSTRLFQLNQTTFRPDRGTLGNIACQVSEASWYGALGPFITNNIPYISFATGVNPKTTGASINAASTSTAASTIDTNIVIGVVVAIVSLLSLLAGVYFYYHGCKRTNVSATKDDEFMVGHIYTKQFDNFTKVNPIH